MRPPRARSLCLLAAMTLAPVPAAQDDAPVARRVRFATFNVALHRARAGALAEELRGGACAQAHAVAEIVQRVRPDVLLLNELDHDDAGHALERFRREYLAVAHGDAPPIEFPHAFLAPVNTGEPTGLDLDGDGRTDGPGDAFGYGAFPGAYGMAVLSRQPIARDAVRTFRLLRWRDVPDARLPADFFGAQARAILRLSSKSAWDVPIEVAGQRVHFLVSHPTPPVFDGPEDRNGRRNADEIRLWADYVEPARAGWIVDDAGRPGGLPEDAHFVVAGDLNADPCDGDSPGAIDQLLRHPRIDASVVPASEGGAEAAARQGAANEGQRGDPRHDTGDFADRTPGNLRLDYVLPSRTLRPLAGAVFWPRRDDPLHRLIGDGDEPVSSDHRLVWLDVALPGADQAPRRAAKQGLVGLSFGDLAGLHLLAPFTFAAHELTLLRWWTNGCPFCADSLPALEELRQRHASRGFAVVAVYHPKPVRPVADADVRAFAAKLGFAGVLAVDPRWEKLRELWTRGAPQEATSISVLVDRAGRVLWLHAGPRLHPSRDPAHSGAARDFRALEQLVQDRLR